MTKKRSKAVIRKMKNLLLKSTDLQEHIDETFDAFFDSTQRMEDIVNELCDGLDSICAMLCSISCTMDELKDFNRAQAIKESDENLPF